MTDTLAVIVTSFTMERLRDTTELLDGLAVQTRRVHEIVFVAERSRDLEHAVCQHVASRPIPNATVAFNDRTPGLAGLGLMLVAAELRHVADHGFGVATLRWQLSDFLVAKDQTDWFSGFTEGFGLTRFVVDA